MALLAGAIVAFHQPQSYEIKLYSEPLPMQFSPYGAIWLNPGELLRASVYTRRIDKNTGSGSDWFYVHRRNWESGWLEFEYEKMMVTRIREGNRMVLVQ